MKKPEFSLAHLTVIGCPPPEMTYIAAMAGYDYVSFRLICMGLPGEANYDLTVDKRMFEQTKIALKETGLKFHDVELARIDPACPVATYEKKIALAAELGARSVLSSVWTEDKEYYTREFADLCDMAAKYGLLVDLEFVTFASVKNVAQAKELLETVNRKNAGIMVDTLHFSRSRCKLEELDELPREWFHFVHLCDAPHDMPAIDDRQGLIFTARDARLYCGEGGVNGGSGIGVADIINRIPQVPYSIELPHIERVKDIGYAEHARRCLETAKQYIADHPRAD